MVKKLSIFTILFIICDQALKFLIANKIALYQYIEVKKDLFGITHVHNTGAAFSTLNGNVPLLIIIALIALILIYYLLIKNHHLSNLDIIIYSLLIGGIIGNLLDRFIHGYVIDYLSVKIFSYDFPIFNLADIGIVISVCLLALQTIKEEICKKSKIEQESNVRIDNYLAEQLDESRSKIAKMIKQNYILVNDSPVKASYLPRKGDIIKVEEFVEQSNILPEKMNLDIVYEDDNVIVVNKANGVVVHPAIGNNSGTLVNGLMYHSKSLSTINGEFRPGIVHRIDAYTTGLLMVAKNDYAHKFLAEQLQNKTTTRKYLALVWGVIKNDTGTIDAPIGRDANDRKKMAVTAVNSKDAITHFKVLERYKNATLIELKLETGRTHQIRVHMNYIGYPVVNDPVYGRRKLIDNTGQCLHAKTLGFIHPITHKYMEFDSELPDCFINIMNMLKEEK